MPGKCIVCGGDHHDCPYTTDNIVTAVQDTMDSCETFLTLEPEHAPVTQLLANLREALRQYAVVEHGTTARKLPCGCDPMVVENAESCKRCDDEDCAETDGCERFRAFRAHTLHVIRQPLSAGRAPSLEGDA